jgi:hypothetical protein
MLLLFYVFPNMLPPFDLFSNVTPPVMCTQAHATLNTKNYPTT